MTVYDAACAVMGATLRQLLATPTGAAATAARLGFVSFATQGLLLACLVSVLLALRQYGHLLKPHVNTSYLLQLRQTGRLQQACGAALISF